MIEGLKTRTVARPNETEWRAWVATLKTGDVVIVCDWVRSEVIFKASVRVTPTGKVYLADAVRERTDWGRRMATYIPGGGERFIAPVSA